MQTRIVLSSLVMLALCSGNSIAENRQGNRAWWVEKYGVVSAREEPLVGRAENVFGKVMSAAEGIIKLLKDTTDLRDTQQAREVAKMKELQADAYGIVYMTMAGFDPGAIVGPDGKNFFQEWVLQARDHRREEPVSFALESRIAGNLVKEIIEKGEHQRSYVGAVFTQMISDQGQTMPVVSFLVPGSPAFAALSGMEGP